MDRQSELYSEAGDRFAGAIARLANSVERDAEKARDLEQEIHAAIWSSLARFAEQCSLKTWVYRVAHNVAADHVAKAARRPRPVPLEQVEALPVPHDTEIEAGRSIVLAQVKDLIRRLPVIDAQVILLWLEGESAAAIAEITGLSAGAVGVRVHRIKLLMANHFQPREINGEAA